MRVKFHQKGNAMRLTVLGVAVLAAASALGAGYITSVRLPDGTTKTFQDEGAWQEIQGILSQKYLKPESVKAGDNVFVTTNAAGEVTISAVTGTESDFTTNNTVLVETIEAVAPTPGNYAAVSNAAMSAVQPAALAAATNEIPRIDESPANQGWAMNAEIADHAAMLYDARYHEFYGGEYYATTNQLAAAAAAATNYTDSATNGIPRITESADNPGHAAFADNADYADNAYTADYADYADNAYTADYAYTADNAYTAEDAYQSFALQDARDDDFHGGEWYATANALDDLASSCVKKTGNSVISGDISAHNLYAQADDSHRVKISPTGISKQDGEDGYDYSLPDKSGTVALDSDISAVSNNVLNIADERYVSVGGGSDIAGNLSVNGKLTITEGMLVMTNGVANIEQTAIGVNLKRLEQGRDVDYSWYWPGAVDPTNANYGATLVTYSEVTNATTLTPVYSDTPTFGEWTITPATYNGYPLSVIEDGYEYKLFANGSVVFTTENLVNATSVTWTEEDNQIATATRARTDIRGYQLGDQSDKKLQPMGDYATTADLEGIDKLTIVTQDTSLIFSTNDVGGAVFGGMRDAGGGGEIVVDQEIIEGSTHAVSGGAVWSSLQNYLPASAAGNLAQKSDLSVTNDYLRLSGGLVAGANITLVDNGDSTVTINSTGGGSTEADGTPEIVYKNNAIVNSTNTVVLTDNAYNNVTQGAESVLKIQIPASTGMRSRVFYLVYNCSNAGQTELFFDINTLVTKILVKDGDLTVFSPSVGTNIYKFEEIASDKFLLSRTVAVEL